jgi:hypothetical protein
MLLMPIFDGVLFLIIFVVVCPLLYGIYRNRGYGRINIWITSAVVLLVEAVACVLFLGWGGLHAVLAIAALPLLIGSGSLMVWFLRYLNKTLPNAPAG